MRFPSGFLESFLGPEKVSCFRCGNVSTLKIGNFYCNLLKPLSRYGFLHVETFLMFPPPGNLGFPLRFPSEVSRWRR